jgi:hypothetical protein
VNGEIILSTVKAWNAAAASSRTNTIARPQFTSPYYQNSQGPASKLPGHVRDFEKVLQAKNITPGKRKQSDEEHGGRPYMGSNNF